MYNLLKITRRKLKEVDSSFWGHTRIRRGSYVSTQFGATQENRFHSHMPPSSRLNHKPANAQLAGKKIRGHSPSLCLQCTGIPNADYNKIMLFVAILWFKVYYPKPSIKLRKMQLDIRKLAKKEKKSTSHTNTVPTPHENWEMIAVPVEGCTKSLIPV